MPDIFTRENIAKSTIGSVRDILTPDLLWEDSISEQLNTYRNLNPIALNHEPVLDLANAKEQDDYEAHYFGSKYEGKNRNFEGRFSLFNHTMAVANNTLSQINMNAPLYDSPSIRKMIRDRSDCSVGALVKASEEGLMGRAVYRYSDFMFCKHLGKISNNYLITLRRFPAPAGDHINYTIPPSGQGKTEDNAHQPDIGRLVTWLGTPGNDMSSILKYDINLPYKEVKAEIQESNVTADSSGSKVGALLNMSSGSYRKGALRGAAGTSSIGFMQTSLQPFGLGSKLGAPPDNSWAYYRDKNKAYGPVDAIATSHYREGAEGGGIKFEHSITLTFDYELRAFDGINTRAAMLDLLSNILAVTFANATYWGGAVHGNGAAQNNIFANLPIFHMQSPVSMAGLVNAVFDSGKDIMSAFNNGKPINGLGDAINALSNFASGAFDMAVADVLNSLGRPQRQGLNALINFAPTGVWHLMIGNPKHPIMSMGNMYLENCSIEHYGPLGLDDFPTGLKVTITLKHATPRDTMRIEQMYMNGDFRVYQPLGNRGFEAWKNAQELYEDEQQLSSVDEIQSVLKSKSKVDENGNIIESPTTTEVANSLSKSTRLFMKYFGTEDPIDILKSTMEAHLGSEPKTTQAEEDAKKERERMEAENEKNKKGRRK